VRKPPPQVTGISPKEGPPGTRVTLRGENLGTDARDLIGLYLIHINVFYEDCVNCFLAPVSVGTVLLPGSPVFRRKIVAIKTFRPCTVYTS